MVVELNENERTNSRRTEQRTGGSRRRGLICLPSTPCSLDSTRKLHAPPRTVEDEEDCGHGAARRSIALR